MNLGFDAPFGKVAHEDVRIGGGDAPAPEVLRTRVVGPLRDGQREAAPAESEIHELFDAEALFGHLVQPHDSQIGDAHRHGLRNVVVAQVEHLERESFGPRDEFALAFGNLDACFGKQTGALFIESALGLDGYSQHVSCGFDCAGFCSCSSLPCGLIRKKPTRKG